MSLKVSDAKREDGFTLIELLVVVIIIGILAAIAIPVFLNQRAQAWERTSQSDARNAGIALESYLNDAFTYPVDNGGDADAWTTGATGSDPAVIADQAELTNGEFITASPAVTMHYDLATDGDSYAVCVQHENLADGVGVVAKYDSASGGIDPDVDRNNPITLATCDADGTAHVDYTG